MAFVTIGTAVDLDLLKMKWREEYVSEGLNRKTIPGIPKGIYRGLRLVPDGTQGPTDRRVSITTGDDSFHEACYQSTTGFSLTYHDNTGTSVILDLSAPGLNSTETVIALFVDYQIGADTTAEWRAYPAADYNALPAAEKDELLVLGTVNVPAADTNVAADDILVKRRTIAWENVAPGVRGWEPLLKGGSFEIGNSNGSQYDIVHWSTETTGGTGTWDLTGDVRSGQVGLKMTCSSGPSFVSQLRQDVGLYLSPTRIIKYRLFKKVQNDTAGGTVSLDFAFATPELSSGVVTHSVTIPASTTNPGFIEVSGMFTPSEATITTDTVLRYVSLSVTGVDSLTEIDFDDVQVWVEQPEATDSSFDGRDRIGGVAFASPLYLMGKDGVFDTVNPGATLSYSPGEVDFAHPLNIGQDGVVGTTQATPDMRLRGSVILGEGKLRNDTEQGTARVQTDVVSTVGKKTLIWESSGGGSHESRLYVDENGDRLFTVNARYNNSINQWEADDTAAKASRLLQTQDGFNLRMRSSTAAPWNDASWDLFGLNSSENLPLEVEVAGNPGYGLKVTSTATTGVGIYVDNNGTGEGIRVETSAADSGIFVIHDFSGSALDVSHSGSGYGLYINQTGTGTAAYLRNASSGHVAYMEQVGSGDVIQIYNDGTGGQSLDITHTSNNTGICMLVSHAGSGTGFRLNCTNATTANHGIDLDYDGLGDCLNITLGGSSTTSQVLVCNGNSAAKTNAYYVFNATSSLPSAGQTLWEFNGRGGSFMDIHSDSSVRIHCDGGPSSSFVINNADGGTTTGDTIFVLAADDGPTDGFRWAEFIGTGSNRIWTVEDGGATYNDQGIYSSPADYAENFEPALAKSNYEPGDVIVISGENQVDKSSSPGQTSVLGVYSTQPAFLGNQGPSGGDLTGGTLEAQPYSWQQSKGPRSDYDKVEIDTNRVSDYPVGSMVRMAGSNTAMTVTSSTHNPGQDKTTVKFDQTWPNDPGTPALYYAVPERNVIPVGLLGQVPTKCITENGTISPGDLLVTSSTPGHAMKAGGSPAIGSILGKALETLTDTGSGTDIGMILAYVSAP